MVSGQLFPVIFVGERDIGLRVNFGEEPFVLDSKTESVAIGNTVLVD